MSVFTQSCPYLRWYFCGHLVKHDCVVFTWAKDSYAWWNLARTPSRLPTLLRLCDLRKSSVWQDSHLGPASPLRKVHAHTLLSLWTSTTPSATPSQSFLGTTPFQSVPPTGLGGPTGSATMKHWYNSGTPPLSSWKPVLPLITVSVTFTTRCCTFSTSTSSLSSSTCILSQFVTKLPDLIKDILPFASSSSIPGSFFSRHRSRARRTWRQRRRFCRAQATTLNWVDCTRLKLWQCTREIWLSRPPWRSPTCLRTRHPLPARQSRTYTAVQPHLILEGLLPHDGVLQPHCLEVLVQTMNQESSVKPKGRNLVMGRQTLLNQWFQSTISRFVPSIASVTHNMTNSNAEFTLGPQNKVVTIVGEGNVPSSVFNPEATRAACFGSYNMRTLSPRGMIDSVCLRASAKPVS